VTEPQRREASPPDPEFDLELLQVQNEIRAALDVWQAAWKSLDHRAIQRIHPSSGVDRRELRPYERADVTLQGCTYTLLPGRAQATADCSIRRALYPRSGEPRVETFRGVRLQRDQGRWIVRELF
jgi:hypothetical protein